ncbi:MAG TPA: hypothetical protein VLN48_09080 [Bryobacteraceae bacterium]|nr:hypothetical protein [Bryobacteraceae bacterium]
MVRTALVATLILSAVRLSAADLGLAPGNLVAHEWGTFTSVAGEHGAPVAWAPLSGPADLPCFVERMGAQNVKAFSGLVRMETPVLYFYAQRPTTLSVHVDFPKGWITEWYPQAARVGKNDFPNSFEPGYGYRNGSIGWDSVQVLPGENLQFPGSKGASHYYAARETDSAPLRIRQQQEKLIFYRGIGSFQAPLWPKYLADGKIEIRNVGEQPIPVAIVFENRGAKLGYRMVRGISDIVNVDAPEMTGNLAQLRQHLAEELVKAGLYRKEALAMIETWHDSWFEEGTRVFYIYPRAGVDAVLPLKITPAPEAVERVFVGRVEVLSPWTRQTIQGAADQQNMATLKKFGRFLEPFATQMHAKSSFMQQAENEIRQNASGKACVQ